jgi:DNA-directed RNA polymerase specialized sigma24 family protein
MDTQLAVLVAKAQEGDKRAENELFQLLLVRFRYIARRKIKGDRDEIEELVQKALVTINEKYKTVIYETSFQAWAYGVLKMKLKAYLHAIAINKDKFVRESEAKKLPIDPPKDLDPLLERKLRECLKQVRQHNINYARAVNLAARGYKAPEMANRLKVNIAHLYVVLNRGRSLLKACMEKGGI